MIYLTKTHYNEAKKQGKIKKLKDIRGKGSDNREYFLPLLMEIKII